MTLEEKKEQLAMLEREVYRLRWEITDIEQNACSHSCSHSWSGWTRYHNDDVRECRKCGLTEWER